MRPIKIKYSNNTPFPDQLMAKVRRMSLADSQLLAGIVYNRFAEGLLTEYQFDTIIESIRSAKTTHLIDLDTEEIEQEEVAEAWIDQAQWLQYQAMQNKGNQ